jgi:hypothetical protein
LEELTVKDVVIAAICSLTLVLPATSQTIDFETLPNGSPTFDGQEISDQYEATFGVMFSLLDPETGVPVGSPVIAKAGSPLTAFVGCGGSDLPLPGQGLGQSFLTDDGALGTSTFDLLISYAVAVSEASGTIIDTDCRVDGGPPCEQWTVTARNAKGETVDEVTIDGPPGPENPECQSPATGPGDSMAIGWSFDLATPEIASVLIRYSGDPAAGAVGIAFDNFSPASVSPPPTVSVLSSPWNKICVGDSVELTPNVSGGAAPFMYQWEQENAPGVWENLGTEASQLVSPGTTTNYRVTVTDAASRTATSDPFELAVCARTPSFDFDGDGDVDLTDFKEFQAAFTGPQP